MSERTQSVEGEIGLRRVHEADGSVVVRVLHEVAPDHIVSVGHSFALLPARGQQHTRVLDAAEREHVSPGFDAERAAIQRAAPERRDAIETGVETHLRDVRTQHHLEIAGRLELVAISRAKARRRTDLVETVFDGAADRQQRLLRRLRPGDRVPFKRADLQRAARAVVPGDELLVADRPPAVGHVVPRLEVVRKQGAAPALPVPCRATQRAHPHRRERPQVEASEPAFIKPLRLVLAPEASALEQHDGQARPHQVERDGNPRRAAPGDTDVSFQCGSGLEGPRVDKHECRENSRRASGAVSTRSGPLRKPRAPHAHAPGTSDRP